MFLSNYADNNNLYSIGNDLDLIKQMLHKDFSARALTHKKCYYMCLGKNSNNYKLVFDNLCLKNSNEEVMLGITIYVLKTATKKC